jgi:hypothetical protein
MPRSLGHRLTLHASAPVHLKTQRLPSNDVLDVTVSTGAAGCTTKIARTRVPEAIDMAVSLVQSLAVPTVQHPNAPRETGDQ